MILHPKNALRLISVSLLCACAVLVCALLLNANIDMARIQDQITEPEARLMYDLIASSGKMTSAITGGALGMTAVVTLLFFIKHYIDTHQSELGILKALGYANGRIAIRFWVFALSVLAGSGLGFGAAFAFMPAFYEQNRSGTILPDTPLRFNPELLVYLVVVPTLAFALLSVLYACIKLRRPALVMVKGQRRAGKIKTRKGAGKDRSFLQELRYRTVRSRYSLVFFIWFSAFTFAATVVMSFSIDEVGGGRLMAVMMAGIGILLAVTTLFLATTTVIQGNAKTIAMLRVFGYADGESARAILSGYRPVTYVGFALGAVYQHVLMKLMMELYFGNDVMGLPDYSFNYRVCLLTFLAFVLLYEVFMRAARARLGRVPLREVMLAE